MKVTSLTPNSETSPVNSVNLAAGPLFSNDIPLIPDEAPLLPPNGPVGAPTTPSGDYQIDGILAPHKWGFNWGSRQLTYSFFLNGISSPYYGGETGSEVSNGVKNNVRTIMNWLSTVINVDLVEVTETASDYGRIRLLNSNGPSYAYAYYPVTDLLSSTAGDVHLSANYDYAGETNGFQNPAGKHGYATLIHEIGHALGLKHSFENPALPANEDKQTNTVMTYSFDPNEPGTFMRYDLKALQYLYGTKPSHTEDTTYQFTSRLDQFTLNGQLSLNTPFSTKQLVWDSDGLDTLDFSQLAADGGGYRFNLAPGGLLSLQSAYNSSNDTIAAGTEIAYNVLLENAVNSGSSDTFYLNSAANTISGYSLGRVTGNDTIWNATNQDTINLSGYSKAAVTRSQTGNDLVLGLGSNGGITLKDYYAGNLPVIVYSDGVDTGLFLSINDVSLTEGNSGTTNATFTVTLVTLSGASSQTVTVNYATANDTATAGSDYTASSGVLTFAPNETSKTINIPVIGDTLSELNETFFVNLSGATNADITDSQGTGTIQNDDFVSLSINDVSLPEGNTGTTNAIFTVTLSGASSQTVTVNYATADGTATAGSDYTASSGIVTFAPGVTSQTITVPIFGDTLSEPNETFKVNLSGATNASIADSQGIGTIVNDEPTIPAFTINDVSLTEGNSGTKNATFTVSLSQASTQTVSVNYATADGTATIGNKDYTAKTGTLTFAPGVTSQTISVAVTGNTTGEADEQFSLNLNTPTNATIADSQGIGTIINDDPALIINDVTVQEGPSGTTSNATFTVTLNLASTKTVQVNYATANGTAKNGNDYTTTKGILTFNPGETTKTITIPILGDNLVESSETFFVNLSGNKNATLLDKQGVGTILNYSATGSTPTAGLTINGSDGADTLQGTENDDRITGLGRSDALDGLGGNDLLIGADPNGELPGLGEIDTLTGGLGADLFVLGDATQVYYDDGNGADSGYGDYGLVVDFNASEGDLLQLHGFAADYSFVASPAGLPSGTAIFLYGELVGLIKDVAPSSIPSNSISYVTFPLANADSATTGQNTPVNISVLANDRDAWAIDSFTQGTQGSITLNNNGTPSNSRDDFLTYTPNTGFSGSDSFSYTISDGNGGTDTATVNVVVSSTDYGDLPDPSAGTGAGNYQTLKANNGPAHQIVSGLRLGATVDGELDGQPNATATGDDTNPVGAVDDEDGVTLPTIIVPGQAATFSIKATNTTGSNSTLYGFVDWNNDGDFGDANESATATVANGTNNGNFNLNFNVPANAVKGTQLGARFRLSTTSGLGGSSNPDLIGGINLGKLTDYLFFFANGSEDASYNWQGATKGFVGDVAVDGIQANERTSGSVPYSGTIYTNDSSLGNWQGIVNQNSGQAFASTGQTARISGLETDLNNAFAQINALAATSGYTSCSSTSLNGLNTTNGINETFVINITSGLNFSSKINITGDAGDVFVLRWDTDGNPLNGYQGQVKPQGGGAIVPLGGLKPSNFINVAGDINASGGGSNPASPYPQGPRFDDGTGSLIVNGSNFNGGGFFTGYWLTTGDSATGDTHSLSNGIFVGGWYTLSDKFSMTSGTSGVHVSPNPATQLQLPNGEVEDYLVAVPSLTGTPQNDVLVGTSNNDFIAGDSGQDTLTGNDGNDILLGGTGNDNLLGGNGSDTFVLAPGEGTDTIGDFLQGTDVIGLSGGLSFNDLTFSGNDILFGSQVLATLTEVDATTLTAGDFVGF